MNTQHTTALDARAQVGFTTPRLEHIRQHPPAPDPTPALATIKGETIGDLINNIPIVRACRMLHHTYKTQCIAKARERMPELAHKTDREVWQLLTPKPPSAAGN